MKSTLLIAGGVSLCASFPSSAQMHIERVQLVLTSNHAAERVAGKLYRVDLKSSDREWIADISKQGAPSRRVQCRREDHFEAEADRPLAVPNDPIRVRCERELSFSFTRPRFALDGGSRYSFLDSTIGKVDVRTLNHLRHAANASGKGEVALAAADSITAAAAIWLGDEQLDKYVQRASENQYRLQLNENGVRALKLKQSLLKLSPTGIVDDQTQLEISERFLKQPYNVRSTFCLFDAGEAVQCSVTKPFAEGPQKTQVRVDHAF